MHTHFIVALAQFLQLLFCDVQLLARIEADRVDDEMGMDVLTVCVRTDENLVSLKVFSQLLRRHMCDCRIDISALWEALHHVVEQFTVRFMVQRFC